MRVRSRRTHADFINCFIDGVSGVYRTGLGSSIMTTDQKPDEPGFSWELTDGLRKLSNRRGERILTIEWIGATEVVKNGAREVIWPRNSVGEMTGTKDTKLD